MRRVCLIFTLFLVANFSFWQHYPDSVFIYVDQRVELSIALPNYDQLRESQKEKEAITAFQELIGEVKGKLLPEDADSIVFTVGDKVSIQPGSKEVIYLFKEGKLTDTGVRDRAVIKGSGFNILITTADMSKIDEVPLVACLEKTIAKLPPNVHLARTLSFDCSKDKVTLLDEQTPINERIDQLEFSFGAGGNLLKNQWMTDFTIAASFNIFKKGRPRSFYLSYNPLFDFDGDRLDINTFVNVGFGWSQEPYKESEKILRVELGYLVNRQGDFFEKDTFRFGFRWGVGKAVNVSPSVYVTDGFDTVYPGMRIGIGF